MIAVFLFFAVASSTHIIVSCGNGTTANIQNIFLGRCYEYLQLTASQRSPVSGSKNCSSLFNTFQTVFSNKTTCQNDYTGIFDQFFMDMDPGLTPADKALFWSGTMDVAHSISNVNSEYITLEDTFPGYVANDLNFCGENAIGFNYKTCTCPWNKSQKKVFWKAASTQFAKNARGVINVLVNGTRTDGNPAFRKTSIFAEVELPNLNAIAVKQVRILVGLNLGTNANEKCETKSILTMQNLIQKRNISVSCVDDPRIVFYVLCTKYPNARECATAFNHMKDNSNELKMWKSIAIAFSSAFGLLLIILLVVAIVSCLRKKSGK